MARGLITAPLSGELIAAWVSGEPLPVPRAVAEACHPNRFALRRLIRSKSINYRGAGCDWPASGPPGYITD
jgi:hypothetical protein